MADLRLPEIEMLLIFAPGLWSKVGENLLELTASPFRIEHEIEPVRAFRRARVSLIDDMAAEAETAHAGSPFEMDAVLYTNNATMFIARSSSGYRGSAFSGSAE